MPSTGQGTDITSIVGFAAVLVILVAAIVAVLFLCTCYGLCKFHSRPVESGLPPTSRRGLIPLPSPIEHTSPAILNAKKKSPSFQNSPLAVDLNVVPHQPIPSAGKPRSLAVNLAPLPQPGQSLQHKSACRQTTAQYVSTQHHVHKVTTRQPSHVSAQSSHVTAQPRRVAALPSLQLHPLHLAPPVQTPIDGPVKTQNLHMTQHSPSKGDQAVGYANCGHDYRRCITPKSASGDISEKRKTPSVDVERSTASAMANHNIMHSYSTEV